MKSFFGIICLVFAVSCGGIKGKVTESSPMSTKLSQYKSVSYQVTAVGLDGEVRALDAMTGKFLKESTLFTNVTKDSTGELKILLKIDKVDGGFVSIGGTKVYVSVAMTDRNGKTVSNLKIEGDSSKEPKSSLGGFSLSGGDTKLALQNVAKTLTEYLKSKK